MPKRIEYIDVMRGIAILLVIFEHCIGSLQNSTARFILSFHMPLFFFISGCFLRPVLGGVKSLIIKKMRSILIPQVTLALICIAVTILFDVLMKRSISIIEVDFLKPFGNWFLITLFLMEMIAIPVITIIKNRKALVITTLALFWIFSVTDYESIAYVQQTLVASGLGLAGYLCKPWIERYNDSASKCKGFGWIVLLVVALLSMCNAPIGMYLNQYGNKILFVITSLIAIYGVFDVSVSLKNTSFIQWCGRESIILYVLQFSFIRVVLSVCTMIIPTFEYYQYPFFIFCFLVVLTMLIPATWFCGKYLKMLFGRW